MEQVYRKPAVKISSICLFNLVNSQKYSTHVWDLWKQAIFKRYYEKGNLIFPFTPSHFIWTKCWKAKPPETSFGVTLWIWKLEREGKKMTKDLKNRALNLNTQIHINVDLV